jgi:hypothetical protein
MQGGGVKGGEMNLIKLNVDLQVTCTFFSIYPPLCSHGTRSVVISSPPRVCLFTQHPPFGVITDLLPRGPNSPGFVCGRRPQGPPEPTPPPNDGPSVVSPRLWAPW